MVIVIDQKGVAQHQRRRDLEIPFRQVPRRSSASLVMQGQLQLHSIFKSQEGDQLTRMNNNNRPTTPEISPPNLLTKTRTCSLLWHNPPMIIPFASSYPGPSLTSSPILFNHSLTLQITSPNAHRSTIILIPISCQLITSGQRQTCST